MTTYTNPRLSATFEDWPHGQLRTRCTFTVETKPGKGQRAVRQTINPKTGAPSAPKALTYAKAVRIVDGDDGRTYIACLTMYGFVSIMKSDMQLQHESIHDKDERYTAVRALFEGQQ